jgi:hypothetical protein
MAQAIAVPNVCLSALPAHPMTARSGTPNCRI